MERQIPGTHKVLSVESVQGILGILSYEWLAHVQTVARQDDKTYAVVFKFNESKA